jgi:peptidoglycan/LPS O-acetylase OafA/YrhL
VARWRTSPGDRRAWRAHRRCQELAVGILGAFVAGSQPHGLARALALTALAQALVGVIAVIAGWGSGEANWPEAIVFLTAFFVALWLASAWLFRRAGRAERFRPGSAARRY